MEKLRNLLIIALLFLVSGVVYSQNGTIRGALIDESSGATIPFANVMVGETGNGFSTDLDGVFSVDLPAGKYTLSVSYIGYSDLSVHVECIAGEVVVLDLRMSEEGQVIDEVVISARQIRNTEAALLTIQRKSANLIDGVSSQSIKRAGDGNVASAIKRVTGISVEGGKYVYVRGLGDRYTKSTLNSMDIPGLDPDRNTLQMDIFPTNIIDNIIVKKSFTPDLPGDFTGGVVDIVTKDFPEEKSMAISLSGSYNPDMHFNDEFLSYEGSNTDWLGFDDGSRDLPIDKSTVIPSPAAGDSELSLITNDFNKELAAKKMRNAMDYSFGFNTGNQINGERLTLGYNLALNYRNTTDHNEDVQFNTFRKDDAGTEFLELEADKIQNGTLSQQNVLLSGLAGFAVKSRNHKLSLDLLRIQNGVTTAGDFVSQTIISNSNTLVRDNLEYSEKSISNAILKAKHSFKGLDIDWRVSPTLSKIEDKDVRVTPLRLDESGDLSIEPSEGAQPRRIYRNLDENNLSGRIDLTKKIKISDKESKIKFGVSYTNKERDYEILAYQMNVRGQEELGFSGDPDEYLLSENIWTPWIGVGTYMVGNFEPANSFNASQNILGTYLMNELPISNQLKVVYGARLEVFKHNYSGQNNAGSIVYNDQEVNSSTDILPSVNLIYSLNDNSNIRTSYSRTLARPSFKEASIAQIYDALSDRTFIGNIDLVNTNINNYDLRVENFGPSNRMFAVSGFYKTFQNPIEIVAFSGSAPDNLQPRNVGNATVLGVELEVRRSLDFISTSLDGFSIGGNLSLIKSEVEMDKSEGGEYESRLINARKGEIIEESRSMQGQAPYLINSFLSYRGSDNPWEANLSYNVQGSSLAVVGIGINADVYTEPFHSLNLKVSRSLGSNNKTSLSFAVSNVLGSKRQKVYESFMAQDQIFEQFIPGRRFSLGINHKFL